MAACPGNSCRCEGQMGDAFGAGRFKRGNAAKYAITVGTDDDMTSRSAANDGPRHAERCAIIGIGIRFAIYTKRQLAATSESSEPLVLGEAKLATDDAGEPADI